MAEGLLLRPEPDLSEFALAGHTHSQYLTSHQSLSNYATKTYVQNQIAAIDFPEAGVTTFNGRAGAVVPKSGDYTAAMVGAAATSHTHSQYLTSHQDLSGYALKSHTHSQYLTSHQSLANYALKEHTHSEYLTSDTAFSSLTSLSLTFSRVGADGSSIYYTGGPTSYRDTQSRKKTHIIFYPVANVQMQTTNQGDDIIWNTHIAVLNPGSPGIVITGACILNPEYGGNQRYANYMGSIILSLDANGKFVWSSPTKSGNDPGSTTCKLTIYALC